MMKGGREREKGREEGKKHKGREGGREEGSTREQSVGNG